jgi:hypothetical protein
LSRSRRCQTPASEAAAAFRNFSRSTQTRRPADSRLRRHADPHRMAALPAMKPRIEHMYRRGLLRRFTRAKPAETLGFGRSDGAFFGETSAAGVTAKTECFQRCNDVTTKMRGERGSDLHLATTPSRMQCHPIHPPIFIITSLHPYKIPTILRASSVTTPRNASIFGMLRRYAGRYAVDTGQVAPPIVPVSSIPGRPSRPAECRARPIRQCLTVVNPELR